MFNITAEKPGVGAGALLRMLESLIGAGVTFGDPLANDYASKWIAETLAHLPPAR